jgi:hypothetical protein
MSGLLLGVQPDGTTAIGAGIVLVVPLTGSGERRG